MSLRAISLTAAFALLGAFAAPAVQAAPASEMIEAAPGVDIHVLEAGDANSRRATLVLIPGWRLTAGVWSDQIQRFSRDRRVIAIDPRSQGESTKTAEGDTPEQRARDLDAVLRKMKVGPIVLVGWSQGVQDVAAYIDQFGTGRIKGIVLVDSTVSSGAAGVAEAPGFAVRQLGLLPILAESPRGYTRGMMQTIITRKLSPAAMDALVDDALKTPTAIGEAMLVNDLFGTDRRPALKKFDRPTLVIASANSPELEAQRTMARQLPTARFEVVEQAGHAVFIDQPERFNALLADFVDKVGQT